MPARSFCAGDYKGRIFACQKNYRERKIISWNVILWAVKIISTAEAAKRLNVTPDRVRKMIEAKRLKATKFGNVWMIDPKDLEAVQNRKVGRPRKPAQKLNKLPKKSARKPGF